MSTDANGSAVLPGLTLGFLALAGAFLLLPWGRQAPLPTNPPTPPEFTNTATVRMSAAELFRTGGDTSRFACYNCHVAGKVLKVEFNDAGDVILPEPHKNLVMRHGGKGRNDHCFNCHDPRNLEQLRVRDGQAFKLTEGSRLCGACHGPTYRDWERGVHGRRSGFWDRKRGGVTRADCTSCHDPHFPAFPSIVPAAGPVPLHPGPSAPSTNHVATQEKH